MTTPRNIAEDERLAAAQAAFEWLQYVSHQCDDTSRKTWDEDSKLAGAAAENAMQELSEAFGIPFAYSSSNPLARVRELEAENERLRRLFRNGFDVDRVLEWQLSSPRKEANAAFTAGGERQAAYLIEGERRRSVAELEAREARVRECIATGRAKAADLESDRELGAIGVAAATCMYAFANELDAALTAVTTTGGDDEA